MILKQESGLNLPGFTNLGSSLLGSQMNLYAIMKSYSLFEVHLSPLGKNTVMFEILWNSSLFVSLNEVCFSESLNAAEL